METTRRQAVTLKPMTVPMHEFYVLASEDEEFCQDLQLGHVTAANPEQAAETYDGMYDSNSKWRAIIPVEAITWIRMDEVER